MLDSGEGLVSSVRKCVKKPEGEEKAVMNRECKDLKSGSDPQSQISRGLARNADSWALLQTCQTRIYALRSPVNSVSQVSGWELRA